MFLLKYYLLTKFFPLQFLLIFRKANAGELEAGSGLMDLFENMTEIDVDKEGVKGAKNFFQAKVGVAKIRMSFLVKKQMMQACYSISLQYGKHNEKI